MTGGETPVTPARHRGMLVILSGPSGAGKSTVLQQLLERFSDRLRLSVSATTRPPRPGERDGADYYFLSAERFADWRSRDAFLECCEVYGRGHWYGTPREPVRSGLAAGEWVLLEIDVEGARKVLEQYPDAVTVFLLPDSPEVLENRLRDRGTEPEAVIQRRLDEARRELAEARHYRYQVVNDKVERAVDQISEILCREGARSSEPGGS